MWYSETVPMRLYSKMKIPTPVVQNGILTPDQDGAEAIHVGSEQWFEWVATVRSFRYVCPSGSFTAVLEKRKGKDYWVGHKRVNQRLRRKHLGGYTELRRENLDNVAKTLSVSETVQVKSQESSQGTPYGIVPIDTDLIQELLERVEAIEARLWALEPFTEKDDEMGVKQMG